jgi:hypothetical protein
LFHRCFACALADSEHGDDRRDAENDAKRGEGGTQAVKPQAFDTEFDSAF